MTKRALVTGSADRAAAVAQQFRAAGVEPIVVTDPAGVRDRDLPAGLDYYVQLPVTVVAEGDSVVRRVRSFLTEGLLSRFAAAELVLPKLAPDATVLLVAGNLPAEVSAPDDQLARLALLRVLAHATRAEMAPGRARVRVVSGARTDREVVDYALTGAKDPDTEEARPDSASSGKTYEDWRTEVMGLVQVES